MEIEHPIQQSIVLKLIHKPEMSFSELLGDEQESNKFAYHLGVLETKEIIQKTNGYYSLSPLGKKLSSFIEGDTGQKAAFPTFAHVLIVRDGDKVLAQKRLKEPFYGYWGLISGKINFGLNVEECAKRDIEEECGLKAAKSELIGINQAKTYEDGKLLHHHIMFYVRLSELEGTLKSKTHKGENAWMTIDEFKKKERFPDPWFDAVLNAKGFVSIETDRIMKDGKFVDCRMGTMKTLH
ncbi:NUDIX domain-containing protein [Candidatus Woesearchaeota archaeon]|nr:NUDIX domain-containing protein [Candidatus Woesearchaeota archaeon]